MRCIIGALCVLFLLIGLYAIDQLHGYKRFKETTQFRELGQLAFRMIQDRAPGVVDDGEIAYISSFDAFFDYVAKTQPNVVSARDAPNPFPGILPLKSYGRMASGASKPDDLLFWSDTVFHQPVGDIQMRMHCTGLVESSLQHSKE